MVVVERLLTLMETISCPGFSSLGLALSRSVLLLVTHSWLVLTCFVISISEDDTVICEFIQMKFDWF